MVDIPKLVEHWRRGALEDWEVATDLVGRHIGEIHHRGVAACRHPQKPAERRHVARGALGHDLLLQIRARVRVEIGLGVRRALVTILEESPTAGTAESALLTESALTEDWNQPEEEDAWSHLQGVR